MASIAQLKKNRASELERLKNYLDQQENKYEDDPSYWKITRDPKTGVGNALIRFLPPVEGETAFFVKYYDHFFKGPTGKYYVEKSLTTLNEKDPVTDANAKIWDIGKVGEDYVRKGQRVRRLVYESNILVVNDPAHPENNGKVFKFKYGKKIFEKLNNKIFPTSEFDKPLVVYDFWDGANFKLSVKTDPQSGFANYDASEFATPSPVSDDDKELQKIWDACYPLQPAIAPDQFKSYDELKAKFDEAIGNHDCLFLKAHGKLEEEASSSASRKPANKAPEKEEDDAPWGSSEDEDDTSFFENLAK